MQSPEILSSSVALINATQAEQYPNVHPYRDQAFITARVSVMTKNNDLLPADDYVRSNQAAKVIVLNIDNDTPVVTLNNDLANEYQHDPSHKRTPRILTVPKIRSGEQKPDEWMISGGMLMHAPDDSLILFERTERMGGNPDGKVIAWPRAYNNPMGRCDDLPGRTCLKEGAQEIMILSHPHSGPLSEYIAHMFLWGRETGITLAEEKDLQAKTVSQIRQGGRVFDIRDTGLIAAHHHPGYDDRLVTVETHLNGRLAESFKAVAAFSPAERTLELARPARLEGPQKLAFISREPFGRKTVKLSPEQLRAAHYGWAMGAFGQVHDEQQNKTVNLGGVLPILQCGVLGNRMGVSRPEEVQVPAQYTAEWARRTLGM